jgi:hypothetical protein
MAESGTAALNSGNAVRPLMTAQLVGGAMLHSGKSSRKGDAEGAR